MNTPRLVQFVETMTGNTELLNDSNLLPLADLHGVVRPTHCESKVNDETMEVVLSNRHNIPRYGIFVGHTGDSLVKNAIPEVVVDEQGCYVLIFKRP